MDTMGNLLKRRRPAAESTETRREEPKQTELAIETPAGETSASEVPTAETAAAEAPVIEAKAEKPAARTVRSTRRPASRAGKEKAPAKKATPERAATRRTPARKKTTTATAVAPTVVAESVSREPADLRSPPQTQRVSVTLDPALRERARIALNAAHNTGDYRLGDFADVLREAAVLLVSGSFAERQLGRLPKSSGDAKVTTTLRVNDALFEHLQRISKKKRSELLQRALVSYLERGLS